MINTPLFLESVQENSRRREKRRKAVYKWVTITALSITIAVLLMAVKLLYAFGQLVQQL